MIALAQRGMPRSIAYIVLTTLQIVPRFQAKADAILDAQRSRGLETEGNILLRLRALLPLIVPLVLGSILDIEERAIALEARGFGHPGPKTSLLVLADSASQVAVRWGLLAGMVILIAARLVVGRWA
jgi:energy-coupling factor transport system permease protein